MNPGLHIAKHCPKCLVSNAQIKYLLTNMNFELEQNYQQDLGTILMYIYICEEKGEALLHIVLLSL